MIEKIHIYIDGNNLYRAANELGYRLDYKKFRGWLRQKYNPENVYQFIGLIPERTTFYCHLEECGFVLIFKQTITVKGVVKGNCDAELVLKSVSDFYTKACTSCFLLIGDGDFGCLVEFLKSNTSIKGIISPDNKRCSILLRNKNTEITFLNDHYHKFSTSFTKEKAPDADVSA